MKMSYKSIEKTTQSIIREIQLSKFSPDYIVGLNFNGALPAMLISNYFDVPVHTLNLNNEHELNAWMAEDAFGYISQSDRKSLTSSSSNEYKKNILVVTGLNNTGETLKWLKQDWQDSCLPSHESWETVWGNNVKFAALVNNEASEFLDVDYVGSYLEVGEDDENVYINFAFDNWWSPK